jgi:4-amino-4-deoxychorismate lyase
MSLLLETIRVSNRAFQNLSYHQQRLEKTLRRYFPHVSPFLLIDNLVVPDNLGDGIYKCRVLYDEKIRQVEFVPYSIRPVYTLAVVEIPSDIAYDAKWADRQWIDCLRQKTTADDILMVKNELLTDTSYANIALWDGSSWFTPELPLLEGVRRAQLLSEGLLKTAIIRLTDLSDFQCLKLLNAMMDFEQAPVVDVKNISNM